MANWAIHCPACGYWLNREEKAGAEGVTSGTTDQGVSDRVEGLPDEARFAGKDHRGSDADQVPASPAPDQRVEAANEPRGCPTPGACSAVKEIARLRADLKLALDAVDRDAKDAEALHAELAGARQVIQEAAALHAKDCARLGACEAELNGLRRFKSGVDEALNSGNGSYRP